MLHDDETVSIKYTDTSDNLPLQETVSEGETAPTWVVGHQLSGELVIEGILGIGGMGEVFLVRRTTDDRLFAVKTLLAHLLRRQTDRQQFLRELQTWIDLPEHPHLTTCRFFRTFKDRLAIFTDYIAGGSLQQWIRDGRITSLEMVFDIAIQMAWGLQTIHSFGVIHQDVKPSNVLMMPDGRAKITDFGLSRSPSRSLSRRLDQKAPAESLVTSAGMTPAYCSPEQAQGQRLGPRTDVWSWAVSVLEMLIGKVTWTFGVTAPAVLETIRQGQSRFGDHVPVQLIAILDKSLQLDQEKRWENFVEVSEQMVRAFSDIFQRPYDRRGPEFAMPTAEITPGAGRWRKTGVSWRAPDLVIRNILNDAGRDPSEYSFQTRTTGSFTSQAMADLTMFEDAREMVEQLISSGRTEFMNHKTEILTDLIFIHEDLGDVPGALGLIEHKIEVLETMFTLRAQSMTRLNLANTYMNKANILSDAGHLAESLPIYDHSIDLTRLVCSSASGTIQMLKTQAKCLTNKARIYWLLSQTDLSEEYYLKSIAAWTKLHRMNKTSETSHCLATTYNNLGVLLTDFAGQRERAHRYFNRAMRLYRKFASAEGRNDFTYHLSMVYLGKANAFFYQKKMGCALRYINQSIEIREQLVFKEGRRHLAGGLAITYQNKSSIFVETNRFAQALEFIDRCIALRTQLVFDENKTEIQCGLVTAYQEKARLLELMGDRVMAIELYKRAISLAERFERQLPREELRHARAYCLLSLISLDQAHKSLWTDPEIRAALTLIQTAKKADEVDRNGRLIATITAFLSDHNKNQDGPRSGA